MVKLSHLVFIIYLVLVIIGLVFITNSSVVDSYREFGNQWQYILKQSFWALISIISFVIISNTSPKVINAYAKNYYILSLMLLCLVMFSPSIQGARRWIDLGFFSLQPSEFVKSALILYLPYLFHHKKVTAKDFLTYGFLPVGLILLQPDLGTALVISGLIIILYFLTSYPILYLFKFFPIAALLLIVYIAVSPYRLARIKTFLAGSHDPQGSSYQASQSLIAIGSGGFWGTGIGQSRQKYNYLPESSTDSIFSIIAEETGVIGSTVLISLYIILISCLFRLAKSVSNPYSSHIITGVASLISLQSLLNLSALTGLLPLTGVPLPFISYGGSSLLNFSASLGLVFCLVKHDR